MHPTQIGNIQLNVVKTTSRYTRSSNINEMANLVSEKNIFAVVDIDMEINHGFIMNIRRYVIPSTVYFPIIWSLYSPESIDIIRKTLAVQMWTFSNYVGIWRVWGYGMFAMHMSDFVKFKMDTRFKGWGGEDNDFFTRVNTNKDIHIIREKEPGLIHHYHAKDCAKLVKTPAKFRACIGSRATYSSSNIGWMLLHDLAKHDTMIYIVIPTSIYTEHRIQNILDTWHLNLPKNMKVYFFAAKSSCDYLKKQYSPANFICARVNDTEYPPVSRNVKMLEKVYELNEQFDWLFKVDDDTYVNTDNLQTLVYAFRHAKHAFLGSRGHGRLEDKEYLELSKPYCMGGPGYLLKRSTFNKVVNKLHGCVEKTRLHPNKEYLWHSDIVISKCIHKHTGFGCWDYESSQSVLFKYHLNIFKQHYTNSPPVYDTVTYHPLKTRDEMMHYHAHVLNQPK
ncbi:galactosyltransferase-related protein [bacterium]|nr:galactosyltransferase-related protein [bacterium]